MSLLNWFFGSKEETNVDVSSCQGAKQLASKYGYYMTCPEDEIEAQTAKSSDPYCAKAQEIASKYGYTVVCPE